MKSFYEIILYCFTFVCTILGTFHLFFSYLSKQKEDKVKELRTKIEALQGEIARLNKEKHELVTALQNFSKQ
jgi:hypothetical protein